jgi:hypothetical protein
MLCFSGGIQQWLSLELFENEMLRRKFGPNREEVTGSLRKYHNEELHKLYISRYIIIIRVMESRRMIWVRHVERMGNMRN